MIDKGTKGIRQQPAAGPWSSWPSTPIVGRDEQRAEAAQSLFNRLAVLYKDLLDILEADVMSEASPIDSVREYGDISDEDAGLGGSPLHREVRGSLHPSSTLRARSGQARRNSLSTLLRHRRDVGALSLSGTPFGWSNQRFARLA